MLTIDSRLLQAKGEMNISEDFNRVLALLDAAVETITDLSERVAALEEDSEDETPTEETPSETTPSDDPPAETTPTDGD